MFEPFISASPHEQDQRTFFSNYIFEKLYLGESSLDEKQTKSIEDSSIKGYKESLDFIFSNESLKISIGNRGLSEAITENFLEFVTKTQKQVEADKHFQAEEKMMAEFKDADVSNFTEKWENMKTFLEKQYQPREFNIEFYNKEFTTSLSSPDPVTSKVKNPNTKGALKNPAFEDVKKNFEQKWEKEHQEKKIKHKIQLIEKTRMAFVKELYENIEKFKKMVEEVVDDMVGVFGRLWGMGRGKWEKLDFGAILKYSEMLKNDQSLIELAETLGRMQSSETELIDEPFMNTRTRTEWVPERSTKSDLIGIKESDDLSSVLFSEIALLSDKKLENIFVKKYAEKKLQTFEYEGRRKRHIPEQFMDSRTKEIESQKGPFILCIDTSGSMWGAPEEVAKALSYAMTKIAIRDKRKCYIISFSTGIQVLNLNDPESAMAELIPFLSHSFNGGTDAEPAMKEALRMLNTKDYKKADIIMVSDFVMSSFGSGLSLAIKAAKKNKTQFHSLVIDSSHNSCTIADFDTNWIYNPKSSKKITLLTSPVNSRSQV